MSDERRLGDDLGGARKPAELLDLLRERLDQLADNHPSAPREQERQRERGERDRPADRDEPADLAKQPDRAETGEVEQRADQAVPENPGTESGDELNVGMVGWGEAGSGGVAEPLAERGGLAGDYRPWFMSSDESAPWFAAESDRPG